MVMGYVGSAIVMGMLLFFFTFKHPWDPRYLGFGSGIFVMMLTYSMFHPPIRCVILLMVPELVSSKYHFSFQMLIFTYYKYICCLNSELKGSSCNGHVDDGMDGVRTND